MHSFSFALGILYVNDPFCSCPSALSRVANIRGDEVDVRAGGDPQPHPARVLPTLRQLPPSPQAPRHRLLHRASAEDWQRIEALCHEGGRARVM